MNKKQVCNGLSLEVLEKRLRHANYFIEEDISDVRNNGFIRMAIVNELEKINKTKI